MKKVALITVAVLALAFLLAPTMLIGADNVVPAPNGFGPGICGGPGFMARGGGFGAGYGFSWQVADVLGMEVDEVAKEVQAGKSYAEIAKAKNVSKEQLTKKLLDAHKARLDQYVQAGTLSADLAKFMQDNMAQRVAYIIDYKYDPNTTWGRGGRGFGGGCRGGGFGGPGFGGPGFSNTVVR